MNVDAVGNYVLLHGVEAVFVCDGKFFVGEEDHLQGHGHAPWMSSFGAFFDVRYAVFCPYEWHHKGCVLRGDGAVDMSGESR